MTAARAALRQASYELLAGFMAETGLLTKVERSKPTSYADNMGFVGPINESALNRDAGLRTRTPTADVYLVFSPTDSAETADRQDETVDAFMDYCDERLDQASGDTLLELIETSDVDLQVRSSQGPVPYIATRCRFRLTEATGGLWQP